MAEDITAESTAQANPDVVADGIDEAKGGDTATKDTAPVVPDTYDLKVAEGSLLRSEDIDRIKTEAKEKGLTNEAAQELADREGRAYSAYHAQMLKGLDDERDGWVKAAESDKEIGGKSFKGNVEVAHRLLKEVASEDFYSKVLAPKSDGGLGLGDHPEMIRIFTRLANKGFANDSAVNGGKNKADEVSLAKRLYPNLA